MAFDQLAEDQREKLALEVVSKAARLRLTRLLRAGTRDGGDDISIIRRNKVVNICRAVMGLSIYVLEADQDGAFHPAEYGWHIGELELAMRRPGTPELVETLADLMEESWLDIEEVNTILKDDGCAIFFRRRPIIDGSICVDVPEITAIDEADLSAEHPNIRILVDRMERALRADDYPEVVHAAGSIFETMAKDIVGDPKVENKSLGNFFDSYRVESNLPKPLLDYMLDIFIQRNREPLAGHGSLESPKVGRSEAIVLVEMTKAFVRAERTLAEIGPASAPKSRSGKNAMIPDRRARK